MFNKLTLRFVVSNTRIIRPGFRADSLLTGVAVMLALTIVQRGVGFVRGVWFCRLLDDSVLGQWAMAQGFITLVTPMMLFGLPGSLPRFVEHYRLQGQLGRFVRRLLVATSFCGAVFFTLMMIWPSAFGWIVFLEPQSTSLIIGVALSVVTMITFNFVNDLVASLRLVRIVSIMQFIQSVAFTALAVLWVQRGGGLTGLVTAFSLANLLAMLPGFVALRQGWEASVGPASDFDSRAMWRRLLPYAAAIWAMNLLGNTFELSDRYMLLHLTPGGEMHGQAAVGQYHSGRIFPALLLSVASLFSGVLMPYLTADWEAGRRAEVHQRLRRSLLALAVGFTVIAAATQVFSPLIFSTLLEGRYDEGLSVMPMAFVFTIWASLVLIGQNYLWVLEKGKWISVTMGVGLVANLAMNAWLVPMWGLFGAVVATLASNLVVVLGLWWCMHRGGYRLDCHIVFCTALPATLLAGPWIALMATMLVVVTSRDLRQLFQSIVEKRFGQQADVEFA